MAVTKILSKRMRLDRLINYVVNPDKTDDYVLTYFYNCHRGSAKKEMLDTKDRYSKRDGIQAFHIIQAFDRGEISPELAHQIGHEFIKEHLPDYEVVLGTHVDKEHIHNHIVLNSVSFMTGKKYHSTSQSYFREIRGISDRLCKEHGLSIIMESTGKAMNYVEWRLMQAGVYTQRELFEIALQENMNDASSLGRFYTLMQWSGYEIRHDSKYPSFVPTNGKYGFRAKQDGRSLTEDDIEAIILGGEDFKAADVAVRKREYVPFKPAGKLHGFQALVASWMYVLGIYGRGKYTDVRVNAADVMRFEQYKRDEEFLRKYGIDNEDQLDAREMAINSEIERLTKSRIIWNSKKKRRKKLYDALADSKYYADTALLYADGETGIEDEYRKYVQAEELLEGIDRDELFRKQTEVYDHVAEVNRELRSLRSELTIIKNLRRDIPHIANELKVPVEIKKEQNERNHENER